MNEYKRIFIVGQPGAGKALLAKTVAEKLGWQFIDADLSLETRIGCTLHDMIGSTGEEAFYNCEAEILSFQINQENIVVATDASLVCTEANRQLLSSEFVIFLQVSTAMQIERLSRSFSPLLPTNSLESFLEKLHRERDELYAQAANLSLNSDENALEKHVNSIVKIIIEDKELKDKAFKVKLDKKDSIFFHQSTHIPVQLSEQQARCLKLLAQGQTSKEIARNMNISYRTVEGNIAKTIELLGCSSSKELIALYHDQP